MFAIENNFDEKSSKLSNHILSKSITQEEQNNYTESLFESIKHINEYGEEFWYARELQLALEYTEWRNFSKVLEKAKIACSNSNNNTSDHFVEVNKMVNSGIAAKPVNDYKLSRYACYLIEHSSTLNLILIPS